MSINWKRAQDKPNSKQKVLGKILLDIRLKVNDLENQLSEKRKHLESLNVNISSSDVNLQEHLTNAEVKISECERKLNSSADKIIYLEKSLANREKEIGIIKMDLTQRTNQFKIDIGELNQKLAEKNKRIKRLELEMDHKNEQMKTEIKALKHSILNKDLGTEQYKRDKELALEELQLEIKIEKDRFSTDIEEKIIEIKLLKEEIETLKAQIKNSHVSVKIIKKIKEIMMHKGFLSDREFSMLIERIEKKYIPLQI